ncbi:MAG: PucR family transcriptional regulator [Actinomycetales bacterium]
MTSPEPISRAVPLAADLAQRRRPGAATRRRVEQGVGSLSTAAVARMEERLPWFRAMSAEDRSWVGLVAQAGIGAFVAWFRDPDAPMQVPPDVFGTAPRELARSVSLGATLEMVRTVVGVVEEQVSELAAPGDEDVLREAVLRYSREVAFAAAHVYAEAAESRGAWDARLETLVLDAVLRGEADESLHSRATALGWGAVDQVAVVAGLTPPVPVQEAVDGLRRGARHRGIELLAAVQGDRLVAILGGVRDPMADATGLADRFADGPVVVGPTVPHLYAAGRSARAALSGLAAVRAWPDAPRPVLADDLLPERVLAGDGPARSALVDRIHRPLVEAGGPLLDTLTAYIESGGSLEATARTLFVHANTVRYRLRRIAEITGYDPAEPREGFVLRTALAVGRLAHAPARPPRPARPASPARPARPAGNGHAVAL